MAVTFNSIGGGSITIGGSGSDPFPKYSISTEGVQSGDGTLIDITYNVSTFANHIIPYSNNRHSRICQIIKDTYTLPEQVANDITSNTNYSINYTHDISINAGTFDSSTGDTITIEVYYLNHNELYLLYQI